MDHVKSLGLTTSTMRSTPAPAGAKAPAETSALLEPEDRVETAKRGGEAAPYSKTDLTGDILLGAHTALEAVKPALPPPPVEVAPPAAAAAAGEETAKAISAGLVGSIIGSAVLGVGFTWLGLREFVKGSEEGDPTRAFAGMGTAILGLRDGFQAMALAGSAAGKSVIASVGNTVAPLLGPLALVPGAITTGFAISKTIDGFKEKDTKKIITGLLSVGTGVALSAAAIGAGLPALIAGGVCIGGKIIYSLLSRPKPPAPPPTPPPPSPPPQEPPPSPPPTQPT